MIKKLLLVVVGLTLLIPAITCAPTEPNVETINIGCVLSTSGLLGPKGEERMAAARLAVEEINSEGGILGKQVRLIEEDDATKADKCLKQIKKIVTSDGVKVLVGGMSSGAVMASGHYLAENEVLMVSPSATAAEISNQIWTNWIFRTAPSDALQGRVLARVIMDRGFTRLATIVQANSYGAGLEKALVNSLENVEWTGKHVIAVHFDPNKGDHLNQLNNIKDSNPDVILAVTYIEDGIRVFKQALEADLTEIAWLGCDGNYGEQMFTDPECAEFMEKAIIAGTRHVSPSSATYDEFASAYAAATGKAPGVYCDTTYDAIKMIAESIEKAGVYDGAAIRDALFEIGQKYQGASGRIIFDDKGDRVTSIYELWNVEKDPATETGYKNIRIELISIG